MPENNPIPIVDFAKCSIERDTCSKDSLLKVGNELFKAFSEVGFVYLKNSGITDKFIDKVQDTTERFFLSSEADKLHHKQKGKTVFGYVGIGAESTNPNIPADFKEAFDVNGESFTKTERHWPDEVAPGFKEAMLGFMQQGKLLGMRIMNALALAMELEDEHFFEKCHTNMHIGDTYTCSRTLYYPPVEAKDLVPGQVRLGEHADTSSITFLFQDSTGGLQVQNVDGEFVDATPMEGTALVNIGDTLQKMTCGALKSTKHRVVVPVSDSSCRKVRRSLVYFVYPNNDTPVNVPLLYKDKDKNKPQPNQIITAEEIVLKQIEYLWKSNDKEEP